MKRNRLHQPDFRTVGSVTLFPLTYVSAPSQGSRTTAAQEKKIPREALLTTLQQYLTFMCTATSLTFSHWASRTSEGAVLVFYEVTTEDYILTTAGI